MLVTDVSRSIDDRKFDLGRDGDATAFTHPIVLTAIKNGVSWVIAVAYVEFAGSSAVNTALEWTTIHDETSASAFASRLKAAPRSFWGPTSIGAGVDQGVRLLTENKDEAVRSIIDVCGDCTNNTGRDITQARDDAIKTGLTFNGLAIINDHPVSWTCAHVQPPGGLAKCYRDNVGGGAVSFVQEIHDFHMFDEAATRKSITEISMRRKPQNGAARL